MEVVVELILKQDIKLIKQIMHTRAKDRYKHKGIDSMLTIILY